VTHIGQASLAGALIVALVVALVLAWRWFERNRARLVGGAQRVWQRVLTTPRLQRFRTRYPRTWTFVSARFARGEYLGLHLTVGLAVSLAGLWLFSAITEDVIHHDPLTQFDVTLLTWLRAHATPTGYAIFNTISVLGSSVAMAVLALGVGILLAAQRRWIVLGGWAAAFAGGAILDAVLKLVIRRPRPPDAADFLSGASWSFPSGHAMGSLIGYGMLAYILFVVVRIRGRGAQIAVVLGAALLIVAIGSSRLYLGVHYFSDVEGGYAAGVLWLSACIYGLEGLRSQPVRR
jgi:membrane-associated phospholipid phosphatase